MKKLFTLLLIASLAYCTQAQDVTTQLGASGNFTINDNSPAHLLTLKYSGNLFLGSATSAAVSERHLNIVDEAGSPGVTLNAYLDDGFSSRARIDFVKARGTQASPTAVVDGHGIGWLLYYGYDGNSFELGAGIEVDVDGTVVEGTVPMQIDFLTNGTSKLKIRADGTINMGGLYATTGDESGPNKMVFLNSDGDLVAGPEPTKTPDYNSIQQLKEENIALKAEMAELRSMIEKLMK